MFETTQEELEEKITLMDNVLHYYDGYRGEGALIVEKITSAMREDGVYDEKWDDRIGAIVQHMVEVFKLMEL